MFSELGYNSVAQQVSLTGQIINTDEDPIKNVLVYLANNPTIYCRSDSLGNFTLFHEISTSITDVKQDGIISFENRNLSLYANNQSISVDIININGSTIKNILSLSRSVGTVSLYPEAYISELPKAVYIARARIGNTFQSFKIQNLIKANLPQGIKQYDISNAIEMNSAEPKSMIKSEDLDTLVLIHDFYKSRKIPISLYSIQFDTIHLNNFADYSSADDFEPAVTHIFKGNGNYTDVFSADSVQFIIDYDTLAILEAYKKVVTIPIDEIESLDNSIKFISGLHFEPSNTKFLQPVQVSVLMRDSLPDNLVVFHCNNKGETYYIPYKKLFDDSCSIFFNLYHFSSIGIGTGEIAPTNPEEFTNSDQFVSYLAGYDSKQDPTEERFYEIWYVTVVEPMINSIRTMEDLFTAYKEFSVINQWYQEYGMGNFEDISFYGSAIGLFSAKMKKIWDELIEEYNGLTDNCLKRAILQHAISIAQLSNINRDLFQADLFDFGHGEVHDFATSLDFTSQLKHLEVGESYDVQYVLKSPSGNPIPEKVIWSSSNSKVASINSDGKVIACSEGVAIIKGTICEMVENTIKVEVGGYNCEVNYCSNQGDKCYAGVYRGTGVLPEYDRWASTNCTYCKVRDHIDLLIDLTGKGSQMPYFRSTWSMTESIWNFNTDNCYTRTRTIPNLNIVSIYPGLIENFSIFCQKVNSFETLLNFWDGYYSFEGNLVGNVLVIKVVRYVRTSDQTRITWIRCFPIDQ
jgi:hypothetical protein